MAVETNSELGVKPRPLIRVAFRPVWLLFGGVILLHLAGVRTPVRFRYGVFLLTILLLGLPHGAVDHLCVPRARNTTVDFDSLISVGILYLVIGGGYAVVWFLAPVVGFWSFILLTWFHWGQGELYPLQAFSPGYPNGAVGAVLLLVVRGGLPMLVPFVFFPDRYLAVASAVVGLFDPTAQSALAGVFTPSARTAVGGALGALTLLSLLWGYWSAGDTPGWRVDVTETTLLWVFFAVVPPVLAIGLYFSLWHSVRHILRLFDLDVPLTEESDRSLGGHFRKFVVDAAPMSVGALLFFGLLLFVLPQRPGDVSAVAGSYLVLLAVLTLPHVVIVTWLDRVQRVWEGDQQ